LTDAKGRNGRTPLHSGCASRAGRLEVVRLLLERGADLSARTNIGFTPLHRASSLDHTEVVRELVAHGADINAQADNGRSPLIITSAKGHLAAATVLLNAGAELALLDNAGDSALQWAERCIAWDAAPPAAGAEPPTAAQVAEHKVLVALLKARSG
jgi:ankyrin repeat protein